MQSTSWSRRAALASLAVLLAGSVSQAQFVGGSVIGPVGPVVRPGFGGPMLATGGFTPVNPFTQAGAAAAVLNPNIATNPFANPAIDAIATTPAYVNPFAMNGWVDPWGGALRGLADVTTANAQALVTLQRARMLNQEVLGAQLDLRRRLIEQARWERMNTPGAEDIRLRNMEFDLARARRNPPPGEVWSGKALNDLLIHLIDQQAKGNKGPLVNLDEETLKKINVTDGTGGNVGLLKDLKEGGKLPWPSSLQGMDFVTLRETMDTKLPAAVNTLKFGQMVEKGTMDDIKSALRKGHQQLDDSITRLTPSEFIEAKRFLDRLDESIRALQNPNATNYFTGKWAAKAGTVQELVQQMANSGLRFAPAAPGDEAAYRVLHFNLASYDVGLPALTTAQPMNPMPPR